MSKDEINQIQDFLTITPENHNTISRIVNVQLLLRRHPPETTLDFLNELHRDYTKKLRKIIRKNKTSPLLNDIVSTKFRIKMAIKTLKKYCNEGELAA